MKSNELIISKLKEMNELQNLFIQKLILLAKERRTSLYNSQSILYNTIQELKSSYKEKDYPMIEPNHFRVMISGNCSISSSKRFDGNEIEELLCSSEEKGNNGLKLEEITDKEVIFSYIKMKECFDWEHNGGYLKKDKEFYSFPINLFYKELEFSLSSEEIEDTIKIENDRYPKMMEEELKDLKQRINMEIEQSIRFTEKEKEDWKLYLKLKKQFEEEDK